MPVKRQSGKNVSTVARVATFLRGLNLFQPFLLCLMGSSFAMRRFGYGNEALPKFVPLTMNAMGIFLTIAAITAAAVTALLKYGPATKILFTFISSGMSMVSVCFTIVINALLLRLYALDDDVDNITRYYWLLLLANFATGIDVTCITSIAADNMAALASGVSLAGLVVAVFHLVSIKILEVRALNIDYWLMVSQLLFVVTLSIIAAVAWFVFLIQDKILRTSHNNDHGSGDTVKSAVGYLRCVPMVLGSAVAWGTLWAVYPYISPFEMVEFQSYYPIQVVCVLADAIFGISLLLLDKVGDCLRQDWYRYPYAWWHLLWFLFIPYFGIAILFLRCMHYPESALAQAVLGRPFGVGYLTVMYYSMSRIIYALGHEAIKSNAMGHGEVISPMSVAIDFISYNVMKYMSAAYVQQFKLAKEGIKAGKAWPTEGMSKHDAVRYWLKLGAMMGYANFKDLATANVRNHLGGVARNIVSYRRVSAL